MKQVTEQDLLNISYEEYKGLGYFDSNMVDRVWDEAGRIKGLPYGDDAPEAVENRYREGGDPAFGAWLEEQGASYYSAPHEHFFIFKAVAQCLKEGNKLVYVEDLS